MKSKFFFIVALLAASGAFAEFSEDTFAFYPFAEGTPGTTAAGVVFKNAVNEETFGGTCEIYNHANIRCKGVMDVDEDVPGKYVFEYVDCPVPEPVFTDPHSIHLSAMYTNPEDIETDGERAYMYSGGKI